MHFAQWATRKRLILLAAALIAVVIIVVVLIITARKETANPVTEEAIKRADTATVKGEYDAAFDTLKQAAARATTNDEKVKVLNDLAAAAANAGQVQAALDYYAQKHLLNPDSLPADSLLMAELYERQDNTQKATEYYQKYLGYLQNQAGNEFRDAEIASITERLEQLKVAQ